MIRPIKTWPRIKSSLMILECHLEVYKVDRLLSDDSNMRDHSKLRVSIILSNTQILSVSLV